MKYLLEFLKYVTMLALPFGTAYLVLSGFGWRPRKGTIVSDAAWVYIAWVVSFFVSMAVLVGSVFLGIVVAGPIMRASSEQNLWAQRFVELCFFAVLIIAAVGPSTGIVAVTIRRRSDNRAGKLFDIFPPVTWGEAFKLGALVHLITTLMVVGAVMAIGDIQSRYF